MDQVKSMQNNPELQARLQAEADALVAPEKPSPTQAEDVLEDDKVRAAKAQSTELTFEEKLKRRAMRFS